MQQQQIQLASQHSSASSNGTGLLATPQQQQPLVLSPPQAFAQAPTTPPPAFAIPPPAPQAPQPQAAPANPSATKNDGWCNVYLARLPVHTFKDEDLEALVAPFGKVISARIMRQKGSGISKGYAFILFHESTSAIKCVEELNGKHLDNSHILECRLAHTEASNPNKMTTIAPEDKERMGVPSHHQHQQSAGHAVGAMAPPQHFAPQMIQQQPQYIQYVQPPQFAPPQQQMAYFPPQPQDPNQQPQQAQWIQAGPNGQPQLVMLAPQQPQQQPQQIQPMQFQAPPAQASSILPSPPNMTSPPLNPVAYSALPPHQQQQQGGGNTPFMLPSSMPAGNQSVGPASSAGSNAGSPLIGGGQEQPPALARTDSGSSLNNGAATNSPATASFTVNAPQQPMKPFVAAMPPGITAPSMMQQQQPQAPQSIQ